jgi:tRNA pseudouridine38-40 synthase
VRLWARVEYDGTGFFGFQLQARRRTVQGEVERAIRAVSGTETRVIGAGRTDRGVHALGQVVTFEVAWAHDLSDLHRALNAVLAADVAIVALGRAPEGFHPRFSAVRRAYRYRILNRRWPAPLERHTAWHVARELDLAPMVEASGCLVGTHDFATFGRPPQGENTVRTVFRAEWQEQRPFLTFDIEADAFLYHMVRSLVGTLVQVGWGQVSPAEFESLLHARDRSLIKRLAPGYGLCLMQVDYATGEGVSW